MSREAKLIVNLTRGAVVCERAAVADRALPRMRGLLGRRTLPAGEGLLLRPAPSVHTAFMRFPIDVVFLDEDLAVVKVTPRLRPWRAASASRARAVLELAAGESAARGLKPGDRLGLIDRDARVNVDAAVTVPAVVGLIAHGDHTAPAVDPMALFGGMFLASFRWRQSW